MNRRFIRILAWMYLALLAAMACQFVVLTSLYGRFFSDPGWYPIHHTAAMVQNILDNTPSAELYQEVDWLQTILRRQIDITAAGETTVNAALRRQLAEGNRYMTAMGFSTYRSTMVHSQS